MEIIKFSNQVENVLEQQKKLLQYQHKTFTEIQQIPECETELNKVKTIVKDLHELRKPLTETLDDIKRELMTPEKLAANAVSEVEANLLQLKKELRKEEERIRAIQNYNNVCLIDHAKQLDAFYNRVKTIIERNCEAFLSESINPMPTKEKFLESLKKRVLKEEFVFNCPEMPEGAKPFEEPFTKWVLKIKDMYFEAAKAIEAHEPVMIKQSTETAKTMFEVAEKPDVQLVQTKDLKTVKKWVNPNMSDVLRVWVLNFDFIGSKLQARSVESVNLGMVIRVVEKYADELNMNGIKERIIFEEIEKL